MLTPATLHGMTPEQRTEAFETLASAYYGSDRYAEKAAYDFGVSRPTVFSWRRNNNVPFAVILLLQEWGLESNRSTAMLREWKNITEQQHQIAQSLAKIARLTQDAEFPAPDKQDHSTF